MRIISNNKFTLIEVVVAITIFALGLVGALALTGTASQRVQNAVRRWEKQHLLAQAAEFLIVNGFEDKSIPKEFFPTDEYKIDVELADPSPENFPENAEFSDGNWALKTVTITLSDRQGNEVDSLTFDRIIYSESK